MTTGLMSSLLLQSSTCTHRGVTQRLSVLNSCQKKCQGADSVVQAAVAGRPAPGHGEAGAGRQRAKGRRQGARARAAVVAHRQRQLRRAQPPALLPCARGHPAAKATDHIHITPESAAIGLVEIRIDAAAASAVISESQVRCTRRKQP